MRNAPTIFCLLLAGTLIGTGLSRTIDQKITAETYVTGNFAQFEHAQRRIFRKKQQQPQDSAPRTNPYDAETAPILLDESEGGEAPIFEFAQPVVPPTAAVEPPPITQPGSPDDPITGTLSALTRLFNGEGDFSDIISIAVAAFALFGGAQMGGSDNVLKIILSLFSGKKNFGAILQEAAAKDKRKRRLRK